MGTALKRHKLSIDVIVTLHVRGLSQYIVDFCYNTRLCNSNSVIFSGCVYILMGTILYKYGWNCSLDNKTYETLLDSMSA